MERECSYVSSRINSCISRSPSREELELAASATALAQSLRRPTKFSTYLLCSLCCTLSIAGSATLMWSNLGWRSTFTSLLDIHASDSAAYLTSGLVILVVLYVLDFFSSPHLPGRRCVLYKEDTWLGRTLFLLCLVLLFIGVLLASWGAGYNFAPALIHTFAAPVVLMGARYLDGSKVSKQQLTEAVRTAPIEYQMLFIQAHDMKEKNQRNQYEAMSISFFLTGFGMLLVWTPWCYFNGTLHKYAFSWRYLMVWVVAGSNVVFGLIIFLRVYLSFTYSATNEFKNTLLVNGVMDQMHPEMHERRKQLEGQMSGSKHDLDEFGHKKALHEIQRHRFLGALKICGCIMILFVGALYFVLQLLAGSSNLASMVQAYFFGYFIFFVVFALSSFMRVWKLVSKDLWRSPLVKSAREAIHSDLFCAALVALLLPAVPWLAALSFVNQMVRRWRGLESMYLYDKPLENSKVQAGTGDSLQQQQQQVEEPVTRLEEQQLNGPRSTAATEAVLQRRPLLTPRFSKALANVRSRPRFGLIGRIIALTLIVVVTSLSTPLLNLFLVFMKSELHGLGFAWLVVITFLAGLVMFLLPPVPGAPVFFFAGVLFTEACPLGFGWGAVISIAVSWILKLSACAMQQKLIGERLGGLVWVQQQCGVHKPFIRTIERILRRPGLSPGKVAILCGGPDWPTSVLAGILRLSVVQMELGTAPIIFFVAPFCLSGSFYIMRGTGADTWTKASNLMFTITVAVCLGLYSLMAWAWQTEFDKCYEEVSRPMAQYVHLDWMDYRSKQIHDRASILWRDLPKLIKAGYLIATMGLTALAHCFFWEMTAFFNDVDVTMEFGDVIWYGADGICKPAGLIGSVVLIFCCLCVVSCQLWQNLHSRALVQALRHELAEEENPWKEARLRSISAEEQRLQEERRQQKQQDVNGRSLDTGAGVESTVLGVSLAQVRLDGIGEATPRSEVRLQPKDWQTDFGQDSISLSEAKFTSASRRASKGISKNDPSLLRSTQSSRRCPEALLGLSSLFSCFPTVANARATGAAA